MRTDVDRPTYHGFYDRPCDTCLVLPEVWLGKEVLVQYRPELELASFMGHLITSNVGGMIVVPQKQTEDGWPRKAVFIPWGNILGVTRG